MEAQALTAKADDFGLPPGKYPLHVVLEGAIVDACGHAPRYSDE